MDIVSKLNDELLKQSFSVEHMQQECLNESKQMAFNYARIENSIAVILSISLNTVNRHRQNILEKLQVNNSIEACRIGKELNLF